MHSIDRGWPDDEVRSLLQDITNIPSPEPNAILIEAMFRLTIGAGSAKAMMKKQWCGIFATLVVNRLIPGSDYSWRMSHGIVGKNVQLDYAPFDVVPGDVVVMDGKLLHHVCVTQVSVGEVIDVTVIEGNTPGIRFRQIPLLDLRMHAAYRYTHKRRRADNEDSAT